MYLMLEDSKVLQDSGKFRVLGLALYSSLNINLLRNFIPFMFADIILKRQYIAMTRARALNSEYLGSTVKFLNLSEACFLHFRNEANNPTSQIIIRIKMNECKVQLVSHCWALGRPTMLILLNSLPFCPVCVRCSLKAHFHGCHSRASVIHFPPFYQEYPFEYFAIISHLVYQIYHKSAFPIN